LGVVRVQSSALTLPANVLLAPGAQRALTVSVSRAPVGQPLDVTLTASVSGRLQHPATVQIPVGQTFSTFQIQGLTGGVTQLVASAEAHEPATTQVTVQSIALTWEAPSYTEGGAFRAGMFVPAEFVSAARLRLSHPAPAGGLSVSVRSTNAALMQPVLGTATFRAGESVATDLVRLRGLAAGELDVVAEGDGLVAGSLRVRVGPPLAVVLDSSNLITVGRGLITDRRVQVVSGAFSTQLLEDVALELTTSNSSEVGVALNGPLLGIGSNNAQEISFRGFETTSAPATVTVRLSGSTSAVTRQVAVVLPTVTFLELDGTRATDGLRDRFRVQLTVANDGGFLQSLPAGAPLQLSVIDANPESIVDGFYEQASGGVRVSQVAMPARGSLSGPLWIGVPASSGAYRIRAVIPGVGSVESSLQRAVVPELRFSRAAAEIGVGMRSSADTIFVTRVVDGQAVLSAAPVTVRLVSADTNVVTVTPEVVIPANQTSASFLVEGRMVSALPVAITATAADHNSPPPALQVSSVQPRLNFFHLDNRRVPGGGRDIFDVRAETSGTNRIAAVFIEPRSIALSIVDAAPADVVDGLYGAPSGGSVISQAVIDAGRSGSNAVYVGDGAVNGRYRIRAESAGLISAISTEQRMEVTALGFSVAQTSVGRGFRADFSLFVERQVGGVGVSSSNAIVVNLSSTNASALGLPAAVTIPAFSTRAIVPLEGLVRASNITVSASSSGYPGTPSTRVDVVDPLLAFSSLELERATASVDEAQVLWTVPGEPWPGSQRPLRDLPVAISIVDATPSSIAPAVFSDQQQLTPQSVFIQRAGEGAPSFFIGISGASGTYRVRATGPTGEEVISGVVTVSDAAIALNDGRQHRSIGHRLGVDVFVSFRDANFNNFYNQTPVTVTLTCQDATVCESAGTLTIAPSCGSECDVGGFMTIRGLRPGRTTLIASAPGYVNGTMFITVARPNAAILRLPELIRVSDPAPRFSVGFAVPGDRSWGEDVEFGQLPFAPIEMDVVSNSPGFVGISTPSGNGKLTIGPSGSEDAQVVLPSPRVPISAEITVSSADATPATQRVRVE